MSAVLLLIIINRFSHFLCKFAIVKINIQTGLKP